MAAKKSRATRPSQPHPIKHIPIPAAPGAGPTPAGGRYAPLPRSLQAKPYDTSSPAYKSAVRRYTGFMISIPILLVTSYVLFDRLVLGAEQKRLRPAPPSLPPSQEPPVASSNTEG